MLNLSDAPLAGSKDRHTPQALQLGLCTPFGFFLSRFILPISHWWPVDDFGRAHSSFLKSALSLLTVVVSCGLLPGSYLGYASLIPLVSAFSGD